LLFNCIFTCHFSGREGKFMNYRRPKILVVDNYDSFTFNLVEILRIDSATST
jgi:hypothetical protein